MAVNRAITSSMDVAGTEIEAGKVVSDMTSSYLLWTEPGIFHHTQNNLQYKYSLYRIINLI